MDSARYQDFIERLCARAPFEDAAAAETALAAVLNVLGSRLLPEERGALSRVLPEQCARMVLGRASVEDAGLAGVIHDVAQAEQISLNRAAEHVDIVTRAVVSLADDAARALLVRAVPGLASRLEAPAAPSLDSAAPRLPTNAPSDLAEGFPGARRSLAIGDPATVAHRHSVARSDDPHGDSKLSGARGLTQEREGDTLASGRPGSRRPISSSH